MGGAAVVREIVLTKIQFMVEGKPVPKARPRWSRRTGKTYTPKRTQAHEKAIAMWCRAAMMDGGFMSAFPLEGAVRVAIDFVFKRTKKTKSALYHTITPDIDNLEKCVLDGINKAGLWKDDSQVIECFASKRFVVSDESEKPHTKVTVTRIMP
jgi:Holliday junction resolvase RusA-like endonuclease